MRLIRAFTAHKENESTYQHVCQNSLEIYDSTGAKMSLFMYIRYVSKCYELAKIKTINNKLDLILFQI